MKEILIKNKQLLVLPLIVLPFLFLIFYVLGGGQGTDLKQPGEQVDGANYQLPEADRQIGILDKKEAYQRQQKQNEERPVSFSFDSLSGPEQIQLSDELGEEEARDIMNRHMQQQQESVQEALSEHGSKETQVVTMSEAAVNSKMTKTQKSQYSKKKKTQPYDGDVNQALSSFEAMEALIYNHEKMARQNDSLLRELQKMQYQRKPEDKNEVLKVKVSGQVHQRSVGDDSIIMVSVMNDCTVRSGNRVMICLEKDILIDGINIKAGTPIYGLCKSDNERLQIQVTSIPTRGTFLPVDLAAYDTDGIKGLYIPDHAARKIYKDVVGDVNPSVLFTPEGEALTYMGLNAAGNMARTMMKSVREKKVHLRQNTLIILKNN
ncbi:conjugative transposon protein TraM [Carboxylicivirga linearis]|uniref:Conjugative transposon protein TraM n=1 Tax=Carboxylicivirga linearis TaxID=1628157 RepID=A0ABS5K4B6_9BACT|nr:conjugative transposon protein TraM [Carboxylicivirga linearis]MBS2101171.1 conjugative transposon protein TraM [Carboxylicivirga linearis]